MFKNIIIFPLIILAGFFGPFFAGITEGRTKNISLELATSTRHETDTKSGTRSPAKISEPIEVEETACTDSLDFYQGGKASWYGPRFHGKKMANGRVFNMNAYTVAHRELPFGTRICINNPENGRWVLATVTDRGNFHAYGRVIDLSKRVAQDLDIKGVAPVRIYLETT